MKRKKSLIAIISLSAFLVIGGAVAYYNSTTNVDNKLKTGQFKSEVVEKFTPKDNWEPGDKVTKEVGVENTGTGNIVSRAMWSETWKTADGEDITITSADPRASVVEKEYGNKWIYSNSDGYFYYDGIISSGGRAEDKFLKSIMLSGDVDFAETKKTVVYYSTMTTGEPSKVTNNPETGWAVAPNTGIPNNATYNKTVVTGNGKYASANYTLTITVQVYQANKQAVAGTAFETVVPETYALLD